MVIISRVINHPKHKSICYHPSILPRHRGASAINWTLIEGDKKGGFSIFWADDGLDTGPLLLQKECYIGENDTIDSIYNRYVVVLLVLLVLLLSTYLAPNHVKVYIPSEKKPVITL